MQNEWWMRPALQTSEAVLLPALERRTYAASGFLDRFSRAMPSAGAFRPAEDNWVPASQTTALSTYVRPRGSMAGRGVLRAAGVCIEPYQRRTRCSMRPFRRFR